MPNSGRSDTEREPKGRLSLGVFLIAIAGGVTLLSRSIEAIGLGDNFDPGPKAFPLGLCAILACGGLIEIWQGLRSTKPPPEAKHTLGKRDRVPGSKTILLLLACFLLYVIVLPWLGFSVATLVMGTGMMVLLGNSWKRSALVSIVLIALIYMLFVLFFKVPLPGGAFELGF